MLNGYEICLNTTIYPIFNKQIFKYGLCTSMLGWFGQVVSPGYIHAIEIPLWNFSVSALMPKLVNDNTRLTSLTNTHICLISGTHSSGLHAYQCSRDVWDYCAAIGKWYSLMVLMSSVCKHLKRWQYVRYHSNKLLLIEGVDALCVGSS